jgi:hypothetical protein
VCIPAGTDEPFIAEKVSLCFELKKPAVSGVFIALLCELVCVCMCYKQRGRQERGAQSASSNSSV